MTFLTWLFLASAGRTGGKTNCKNVPQYFIVQYQKWSAPDNMLSCFNYQNAFFQTLITTTSLGTIVFSLGKGIWLFWNLNVKVSLPYFLIFVLLRAWVQEQFPVITSLIQLGNVDIGLFSCLDCSGHKIILAHCKPDHTQIAHLHRCCTIAVINLEKFRKSFKVIYKMRVFLKHQNLESRIRTQQRNMRELKRLECNEYFVCKKKQELSCEVKAYTTA